MILSNACARKLQNPYVKCTAKRLNRDTVEREHAQTAKSFMHAFCMHFAYILYAFYMDCVCILHGNVPGQCPPKRLREGARAPKCVGGVSGVCRACGLLGGKSFGKCCPSGGREARIQIY